MTDRSGFFVGHPVAGWGTGGGSLTAITVTTNTACTSNNAYIANSASQLTFTLPAAPALGDRVQVLGLGAGGWQLNANTGQTLYDTQTLGGNGMAGIVGTRDMAIELVYAGSNTWIVDAGRGTVTAATPQLDPFWTNVTCLLAFSNNPTDGSGNALAVANSGITYSNSSPKFPGTYYAQLAGANYATITSSNNSFAFNGDFTWEAYVYPTTTGQSSNSTLLLVSAVNGLKVIMTAGAYTIGWSYNGSGFNTSTGSLTQNQWNHVAIARAGTTATIFINGAASGTTTGVSTVFAGSSTTYVGYGTVANTYFPGNICQMRVTNGVARYTAPFTVPAVPWCTVGDTGFDPWWTDTTAALHLNNTLIDSSGNAQAYAITGTVTFSNSTPKFSGTYYASFSTGSSYIAGPSGNQAFKFPGDFTVEGWVYPSGSQSSSTFINMQSAWDTTGFDIYMYSANTISFAANGVNVVNGTLTLNAWNHIAVSRTGGVVSLFVNGQFQNATAWSNAVTDGLMYIGGSPNVSGTMTGSICDVRVTAGIGKYTANFTLPAAPFVTALPLSYDPLWKEVTSLIPMAGNLTDYSGYSYSGIPNNITYVGNPSLFGNQMANFDGSTSYFYVPTSNATKLYGDLTLEVFARTTSLSNSPTIYDGRGGSSSPSGFQLYINTSGFPIVFTNNAILITSSVPVQLGVITHFAVVRAGSMMLLFVNGALGGSASYSTAFSDGYFKWGYNYAGGTGGYFPGQMGQMRLTNGRARYTANFTPPAAAFLTTGAP